MANTLTLNSVDRSRNQFQGAFPTEMWLVKATWADQDAVGANDTMRVTLTVPGVALGDMIVGLATSDTLTDGTDQAIMTAVVTAANTVTVSVHADVGEFAADSLNSTTVKLLVARPGW